VGVRPANAEMIAQAVPAPLADDLVISIELAQADLEAAVETKALRHDPYRAILVGLSMSLGVFGKAITRWDSAVADVIASRDPLPAEERAALVHELVAATKQGAFEGMRKEAARMVRTLDRGLAALAWPLVVRSRPASWRPWRRFCSWGSDPLVVRRGVPLLGMASRKTTPIRARCSGQRKSEPTRRAAGDITQASRFGWTRWGRRRGRGREAGHKAHPFQGL